MSFRGAATRGVSDVVATVLGPPVSPAPRAAWDEALLADPFALESQSPGWTDAACSTGAFEDASRYYETVEGRPLVLPMLRRRPLRGQLAVEASNPPGWGVGGLVAPGGPTAAEIAAVFADLGARRVLTQRVWPHPLLAPMWSAAVPRGATATPRVAHLVDLEGGFDHVWSHLFESASRRGARRAERDGVTVERDTTGRLVAEFHELLTGAVARWSRLQHEPRWLADRRHRHADPLSKFQAIATALGDRCHVWVARLDGKAVASMIVLRGTNAYDFRAAMDEAYRGCRANDLLLRLAIEDACEAGCRTYYMGDSGHSESLGRFKERFGAQPYRYADYLLERLPISGVERGLKRVVKRAVGFQDGADAD